MKSIAAAAFVVAFVLSSCADVDGLPTVRAFNNQSGQDVTVVWVRKNGERVPQATIPAGETRTVGVNQFGDPKDACLDGDVVAIGTSGEELARREASCEPWTIGTPTPDPSP
jgi:hypothetical protein